MKVPPLLLFLFALALPVSADDYTYAGTEGVTAAKAMRVPEGFKVTLAASEPDIRQPIAMAFDERGRLWVAEGYTYPQRRADADANDRILIFEDKDGDGKFDERKIFAEKLNLVSGIEIGFGGVWVGSAPNLLFLPDRNRDDVPDGVAEIVLDGWGYEDTHEMLNTFIWGPDGWLYGCHGVFTHSNVGKPGTPDAERVPLNAGIWRYHPVRKKFEVFAWGTSNPWGVDFNDEGRAFLTSCVIPHLYQMIQGARYERQAGQHFDPYVFDDIKTIADHRHWAGDGGPHAGNNRSDEAGGGHAHSGAMIYLGGAWPAAYRNSIFMNNIHGARINNDILEAKGSGYVGHHGKDFLLADDRASQILNLRYGPDGQVFMIDWYDTNQCHSGDITKHDRSNGRIFKVSYGEAKAVAVDLQAASDVELVGFQLSANDWYVRHARKVLQERAAEGKLSPETKGMLLEILNGTKDVTRQLRALWALHVTALLDGETLMAQLDSREGILRGWAIQLLAEVDAPDALAVVRFGEMARSEADPVTRLYLASVMQKLPVEQRWEIAAGLLSHAEDADDHNLPLVIWYGIEPLVPADPARAIRLVAVSRIPKVSQFILRRAANLPDPAAVLGALRDAIDESEQLMILDQVAESVKGRASLTTPEGWPEIFAKLSQSSNERIRDQVLVLTVKFGDRSVFPVLRTIVGDPEMALERRLQALDTLANGKDAKALPLLIGMLDEYALRENAIRGLSRLDDPSISEALLSRYPSFNAAEKREAVGTLATRPESARALLNAASNGKIPPGEISAFAIRQIASLGDPGINETLNRIWGGVRGLAADKAGQMAEFKERLTPEVMAKADVKEGRVLFNNICASCHTLFGAGGKIGPDLTGSNRANLDYVLENILDPSAIVGRDYQMHVLHLKDGRVLAGLVKESTDSAVTVQLLTEATVVAKEEIAKEEVAPVSMMPEGLLLALNPEQCRDLIAYLASPSQVPLPGTEPIRLEGEEMRMLEKTAGRNLKQDMSGFPKGKWSADFHLWWTDAKPGDKLHLEVPVAKAGDYQLNAVMTMAPDYGVHRLSLDGENVGDPIDCYNRPDVITTGVIALGTHRLEAGNHRLIVEIEGANPKAEEAFMFGLDYLELIPVSP
jgi:putative membrane-bound dehydrogenase-like protein